MYKIEDIFTPELTAFIENVYPDPNFKIVRQTLMAKNYSESIIEFKSMENAKEDIVALSKIVAKHLTDFLADALERTYITDECVKANEIPTNLTNFLVKAYKVPADIMAAIAINTNTLSEHNEKTMAMCFAQFFLSTGVAKTVKQVAKLMKSKYYLDKYANQLLSTAVTLTYSKMAIWRKS